MQVNGTTISITGLDNVSENEILGYLSYIQKETTEDISRLDISAGEDGNVVLDYTLAPPKFQRIRRITGYLVGTIDRWNNAKRAEEHDRVKHGLTAAQ